jgi:hypothetical protein
MNQKHPLVKYGIAVALVNHQDKVNERGLPAIESLIFELRKGMIYFRLGLADDLAKQEVTFKYLDQKKADAKNFVYLAPNVITSDEKAGNTYGAIQKVLKGLEDDPLKRTNVTMSIAPMAGDYLVFSSKARKGAGKMTFQDAAASLITSTTLDKPSLAYKKRERGTTKRFNVGIIPDLDIPNLVTFVRIMKDVRRVDTKDYLRTRVHVETDSKGTEKKRYPFRPPIFDGNFPYAPRSSAFSKAGLLASIAELVKDANYRKRSPYWQDIARLLERLPHTTFYLFSYGQAETFRYDHYVVELALDKYTNLYKVVEGLYRSRLFHYPERWESREEYEKFDLFASRFLQLFNQAAFTDFFALRAEYSPDILPLINTFFMKKHHLDPELVASAKALGAWINQQAYRLANADTEATGTIYEKKAKVLATVESSIMSSPSAADFAVRAIRDISQHSKSDAPPESSAFLEAVLAGQVDKQTAKHMLLAFSRIGTWSKKELEQDSMPSAEAPDNNED